MCSLGQWSLADSTQFCSIMGTWLTGPWTPPGLLQLIGAPGSLATGNRRGQTSPERYLELATECMKKVYNMGPLQINHSLCQYLSLRLLFAIQAAYECKRVTDKGLPVHGFIKWCHGILKVLLRLARIVESFVSVCCNDQWIQHVILLTDVVEYVSLLGYELNTCRRAFLVYTFTVVKVEKFWRSIGRGDEAETVKLRFNYDQSKLLEKLEALVHSSTEECKVATFLLRRRTFVGPSSASFWEVDYENLEQLEKLGGGSAGFVYKTLWHGVQCAEKTFFGSNHPSFKNEVSILAGLSHPNIVPLFCYAMDNRQCSIVMELMEGDLFHLMQGRLRRDKRLKSPFTLPEAVDIMLQIAGGMDYLHKNKVLHRDLKSHNILVKSAPGEEYLYVKVADFGLSKTKETSTTFSNQTLNTGTTRWMAPELMDPLSQASASLTYDNVKKYPFKSDVYSFAMVCYEILTGEVPFQTTSSQGEVRSMVLDGWRPNLPDQCLPSLRTLIQECWNSDAKTRPSFGGICNKLQDLKFSLMLGF